MNHTVCQKSFEDGAKKICISDECTAQNPWICENCEEEHEHSGAILAIRANKLQQIRGKIQAKSQSLGEVIKKQKKLIDIIEQKILSQKEDFTKEQQRLSSLENSIAQVFSGKGQAFSLLWKQLKNTNKTIENNEILKQKDKDISEILEFFEGSKEIQSVEVIKQSKENDVFGEKLSDVFKLLPISMAQTVRQEVKDNIKNIPASKRYECLIVAKLHEIVGEYEQCQKLYERILKERIFDVEVLNLRAKVLKKLKKYEEACDDYSQLIDITKGQLNAENFYFQRGQIKRESGQIGEAIKDYKKYIQLAKEDRLEANKVIGAILKKENKIQQAIPYFENNLKSCKDKVKVFEQLIECSKMLGKKSLIIHYLNEILTISPNSLEHLLEKASLNYQLGHFLQAEKDYTQLIQSLPKNARLYYNRGLARMRLNKLEESLKDFDTTIVHDPEMKQPYLYLGNLYMDFSLRENIQKGLKEKFRILAKYYYENAIQFYPSQEILFHNLGLLYTDEDQAKALKYFTQSITLKKDYVQSYMGRMKILLKIPGKQQEALNDINDIIRLEVRTVQMFYLKTILEEKLEKYDDALRTVNQILNVNSENVESLQARIRIYKKLNKMQEAEEDSEKLKQITGKNTQ